MLIGSAKISSTRVNDAVVLVDEAVLIIIAGVDVVLVGGIELSSWMALLAKAYNLEVTNETMYSVNASNFSCPIIILHYVGGRKQTKETQS